MSDDVKTHNLKIAKIRNGYVIDHIKAGEGIRIFNWLGLGKSSRPVAFLVNAESTRMDRKDIIKIDTSEEAMDLNFDVLALVDPKITVTVIKNEEVVDKKHLSLPQKVENVLICKNPRCITSTEKYVPHVFHLDNAERETYRCEYCDEIRSAEDFR
jgi:aspartate carbamoyltransferase regulatory subunit